MSLVPYLSDPDNDSLESLSDSELELSNFTEQAQVEGDSGQYAKPNDTFEKQDMATSSSNYEEELLVNAKTSAEEAKEMPFSDSVDELLLWKILR